MRRIFGDVTISNGLDWTPDGKSMFYIDTTLQRVDRLDVVERDVINRRPFINFPESMGMPDGMSVDANGNLWVAFGPARQYVALMGKTASNLMK